MPVDREVEFDARPGTVAVERRQGAGIVVAGSVAAEQSGADRLQHRRFAFLVVAGDDGEAIAQAAETLG
jgi:hypothetical protein